MPDKKRKKEAAMLRIPNRVRRTAVSHRETLNQACQDYMALIERIPTENITRTDVYLYASQLALAQNKIKAALAGIEEAEGVPGEATP